MVQVTPSTDIVHAMFPLGSANATGSVDVDDELDDGVLDALAPAVASRSRRRLRRHCSR